MIQSEQYERAKLTNCKLTTCCHSSYATE